MSLLGFRARGHPQQARTDSRQTSLFGERSTVDDRSTTQEVFGPLHERFGFTVDVAASARNTKCERFYSIDDDGLEQSWANERVWCNPPYSDISPWVAKAWREWTSLDPPQLVVMLLPANRTEQGWWQLLVEPNRDKTDEFTCEFLRGRLRFIAPGSDSIGPNERPPFGCCLLIWSKP